ncbi:MAG: hypothetical protein ACLP50_10630 [Solirubrobacteraceae bacterium]
MGAPLSLVLPPGDDEPPSRLERLQALAERELALLALSTGGHLPVEIRLSLEALADERRRLLGDLPTGG